MPDPDPALDLLAPADTLAARLLAVPELEGVDVIVARQRDLATEIDEGVAKAAGAAVLIALDGWDVPDPESDQLTLHLDYRISLWTSPLLRDDEQAAAVPESMLLGALLTATHGWGDDCPYRWEAGSGSYVPHPQYRVYEFPARIHHPLPLYEPES